MTIASGEHHSHILDRSLLVLSETLTRTQEETRNGRRLLRFTRHRKGRFINLSYSITTAAEAKADEENVISCLLAPGATAAYVTYPDLLRVVFLATDGSEGPIPRDYKMRVRRAFDSCDPFTIKKKEPSHSHIFSFIKSKHAPRAIRSSQDFKILPWSRVEASLKRVISRFVSMSAPHFVVAEPHCLVEDIRSVKGLI